MDISISVSGSRSRMWKSGSIQALRFMSDGGVRIVDPDPNAIGVRKINVFAPAFRGGLGLF
jgi:hypothetical protein